MPLYKYEAIENGCPYCANGFEVLQAVDEEPLKQCPKCGAACRKVFAPFAPVRSVRDMLSPKNLERHGFTQYKRTSDGFYEKTAGPGPDLIRRPRK